MQPAYFIQTLVAGSGSENSYSNRGTLLSQAQARLSFHTKGVCHEVFQVHQEALHFNADTDAGIGRTTRFAVAGPGRRLL